MLYYAIGFILIWLVDLTLGRQYIHGPGLQDVIGILLIMGGGVWLVTDGIKLLAISKDKATVSSFLCHLLIVGSCLAYFWWIIYQVRHPQEDATKGSVYIDKRIDSKIKEE